MSNLTLLHLAFSITDFLSKNGKSSIKNLTDFFSATESSIFQLKKSIKLATELGWIGLNKKGYEVLESGLLALSRKHWRLLEPTVEEALVLSRWELQDFLIDSEIYGRRPKVLDLFAGVGGLSLGFESAGFEIVAAMDNDRQACEAHKQNFPATKVIEGDINIFAKNPKEYLRKQGIFNEIDGIIGGPPCQGFSNMGERVVDDDRNFLTTRFTEIVNGIKPKFFMMENVAGLKSIGTRPPLQKFLQDLGKPIGIYAASIVSTLPEVSKVFAKRGPQFKKRLISTSVTLFKSLAPVNAYAEFSPVKCYEFISKSPKLFARAFKLACESECPELAHDSDWVKKALHSISQKADSVQHLALGTYCESNKNSKVLSLEEFVNDLQKLTGTTDFSKSLKATMAAYWLQPTAKKFKGELIGPVLAGIVDRVKNNYEVFGPQVLNSYKFGSPQSRQRLFIIGVRKDIVEPLKFPEGLFRLPDKFDNDTLPPAPTCEDALNDLPNIDSFTHLLNSDKLSVEYLSVPDNRFSQNLRLHSVAPGDWSLPRLSWNPLIVDCCTRTTHSQEVVQRLKSTTQGMQDKKSGKTRLKRGGVSHTLRAGTKEEKGSHTAVRPVHYEHHRVISVREGARLMGFPDWMTFHPTKWHGFRLVGNAVPLQLGRSVAFSIMKVLEKT